MYPFHVYRYADCPREVFRFRYEVYVEELHRKQTYACHETRTIEDPMDRSAYHGVATNKAGEIAATIRLNYVRDGGVDPYYGFYEIDKLSPREQDAVAICTRNMTAKRYRHTPLGYRMIRNAFVLSADLDATICYIDVNKPLIPLFRKLGFRERFEKDHPDYGLVTIMRLDGLDVEYLTKIGSPFAPLSADYLEKQEQRDAAAPQSRNAVPAE